MAPLLFPASRLRGKLRLLFGISAFLQGAAVPFAAVADISGGFGSSWQALQFRNLHAGPAFTVGQDQTRP